MTLEFVPHDHNIENLFVYYLVVYFYLILLTSILHISFVNIFKPLFSQWFLISAKICIERPDSGAYADVHAASHPRGGGGGPAAEAEGEDASRRPLSHPQN